MSPREKRFIAFSSLVFCSIVIFCLVVYYIPTFFYIAFILGVCCVACIYHSGESLNARLGPHPRHGLTIPPVLRRWLPEIANGLPTAGRVRSRTVKGDVREPLVFTDQRRSESAIYRKAAGHSDSFLFSPRDILMGSYIGKAESPPTVVGRPRAGANSRVNPNAREQLREILARPNHAVYTPNKRLSFGREPLGMMGRFTITPQRHYPLQQTGTSSVGILPPAQWDGFRKKNILSPRNSPAVHSPVTVKIARPDRNTTQSPFFDHLNSPGILGSPGLGAPADPCSRETVLSMLKESRKREVDKEDDRSFTAGQKGKRRRHDSSGSAHSAFEPLLPNGAPTQLVPKPGTLKRGLNTMMEESTMKKSRTSSISSVSCGLTPSGTLGSVRNSIRSSLSSSQGFAQRKKASTRSLSPLSSPGSSRSQTPERASKKPREEDARSPSSASSTRSDKTLMDPAPTTEKLTPAPEVRVASDSAGSGKRKRKIPLVSSRRGDQISLPPPPELGYTITVKDLDQEKKAALSQINTVLEECEKSAPVVTTSYQPPVSSDPTPTLATLLASPLSISTSASVVAPIPVVNLDPVPSSIAAPVTTNHSANPLLESLKMMRNNALASAAATTAAPAVSFVKALTPAPLVTSALQGETSLTAPQPTPTSSFQPAPTSLSQPASTMSSAFIQVLSQVTKAPSSVPTLGGASLFGLANTLTAPSSSLAPTATTEITSSNNPLLASVFKPIFGPATPATSAPESTPAVPTFKPIFGSATASAFGQPAATSAPSTASASASLLSGLTNSSTVAPAASLFTGVSSSTAPAPVPSVVPAAPPSVKSLFGNWSAPPAMTSATTIAPATGSTFQFGATSTTAPAPTLSSTAAATTSNNGFLFGAMTTTSAATQLAPPATAQGGFTFGQAAATQNSTTPSFSGFGMATAATTTAAAPAIQSTFTFGKSSFDASAASAFPSATQAPAAATAAANPFAFGSAGANPAPFAFGAAATTAASTFGTPTKLAFGASSTGFAFGNTAAAPAAPAFGSATQTAGTLPASAPTFSFGGVSAQQAPATPVQPTTGGFNFSAAISGTQFGTPNLTTQTPGFNFGAAASDKPAFGTSTPTFGQSTAAGPIPFGSPGTPVQGFSALAPSAFGSPSTPSFSIGAGSKTSGARQRLQARRQHPRKK
ncbi:nuclear envelope pore membrane protein POM 121 [Salmo salar]|uniref:Nuclear envelope pore membrane protein POM 121 n=1 Tax=Salmo salar TaxID=8030 RepID=A0A1S3RK03_SALSA|nr:nuclear envelope pore membrane protein POM 121 [Salmo salar]|eukprot:XP_014052596.1 PREDICTED: nuclear envelope pore membrane protein POM 121-like [Salmo salar]